MSTSTPAIASAARTADSAHPATAELRSAVARLARRLRAERADDTISDGQFSALAHLKMYGPHSLTELAERERVTAPSMNRTVNCLQEAGYLERVNDPDDGRRVSIRLTAAGRDLIDETLRRRDAWLDAALDELDASDRAALAAAVPVLQHLAAR